MTTANFFAFAANREQAFNYLNEYVLDHSLISESSTDCACGETECIYFVDNNGDEQLIIICEACFNNAANYERL